MYARPFRFPVESVRFHACPKLGRPPIKFYLVAKGAGQTIRFYSTDEHIKNMFQKSRIFRVSTYEPRAGELINALQVRDYPKANKLIILEKVDVNGHDRGENTPLTDAAMRGDVEAIKFLCEKHKVNLHASCDCPHHKTALHYAAENGHKDTVDSLLKFGANPNVKDSRDKKPSDVAKTEEITILLREHEVNPRNLIGMKKQDLIGSK